MDSELDLDAIPQDLLGPFPPGVSEVEYLTVAETEAFVHGLTYADDTDVYCSQIFRRGESYVVRVRIGNFDDEEGE